MPSYRGGVAQYPYGAFDVVGGREAGVLAQARDVQVGALGRRMRIVTLGEAQSLFRECVPRLR
jgi:hypothetical protein